MTPVEFERMLSARPSFTSSAGHDQEAPCLRDMVFDYFCRKYPNNDSKPQQATKEYTDRLFERLVRS